MAALRAGLPIKTKNITFLPIFALQPANESFLRVKFMAKIRNFESFGGCIPTFLPL